MAPEHPDERARRLTVLVEQDDAEWRAVAEARNAYAEARCMPGWPNGLVALRLFAEACHRAAAVSDELIAEWSDFEAATR